MKTTENNKLISEFMGLIYKHHPQHPWKQKMNSDGTPYRNGGTLNENTDVYIFWNPKEWNDLMSVVEKIGKLPFSKTKGLKEYLALSWNDSTVHIFSTKEEVYKAVTEFIKWYNKN